MFSTDISVEEEGSPAYLRMQEYKKLFDEFHVIVVQSFPSLITSYFRAARVIRKNPGSFVVSTQEEFTGLVGQALKFRYGVHWQAQMHTDTFSPFYTTVFFGKNLLRVLVAEHTLLAASCIRVVSERLRERLTERDIDVPISVLPIYADVSFFQKIGVLQRRETLHIAIISRLTREKNIELALHALRELTKTHPRVRLTIRGSGNQKEKLTQLVRFLGLESYVEFRPHGSREEVAGDLAGADCFLLASWYEGYGLGAVEAMAAGRVVIMSDVGIAGELVKNGETGLIFPPGDRKKLLQHLIRVAEDFEFRKKLGEAARSAVRSLPTKEQYLTAFRASFDICKN